MAPTIAQQPGRLAAVALGLPESGPVCCSTWLGAGAGCGNSATCGSSLMIPFPVFWAQYTAKVHGWCLKNVPCENCSTEYVYMIDREATGAGTSMYMLNNEGAAGHATSAASETLASVLENDFDPVPCPACGHYQRY